MTTIQPRIRAIAQRLAVLGSGDRVGGVGLAVATVVALGWANWPGSHSYQSAWEAVAPWSRPLGVRLSYRDWVNEALMVGFFVIVGLEIRREVVHGELRSWRRSATPIIAALGGMAVPALLYLAVLDGGAGTRAWGVPMATDVAFALGALALVARNAPARVRVFLLTLAVADDIASVVVLVCFYSRGIRVAPLLGGGIVLLGLAGITLAHRLTWWLHLVLGVGAWWGFVHAGVAPAVVGVVVGLCLPSVGGGPLHAPGHDAAGWEVRLQPLVNLLVLPVFALANAGLRIVGSGLGTAPALRLFAAVLVARVLGKMLGIPAATWAVVRVGGPLFAHASPRHVLGIGAVSSVGFTVPLLIIRQALPDGPLAGGATAGLLVASIVGAALGAFVFRTPPPIAAVRT